MGCEKESPYTILGVSPEDSLEVCKSRYKALARKYHPDKVHGLSEAKKKEHEEYFKKVTVAYHTLCCYKDDSARSRSEQERDVVGDRDLFQQWERIWNSVSQVTNWREIFHNTLWDVAHLMQRHTMKIPVTVEDIHNGRVKKVRLLLQGCPDAVYAEVNCGMYPQEKVVTHMEAHGIHHRIRLEMFLDDEERWLGDDGRTLHQEVYISWSEYVHGVKKTLMDVEGNPVDVDIPPFFHDEEMILSCRGLARFGQKNDWVLHIYCQQPTASEWSQEREKIFR